MVVNNKLMPLFRDCDVLIAGMIEQMLQYAIEISILQHHIEQTIAMEPIHPVCISALLARFRLHLEPLLTIVGAGCCLAAFINSLDSTILLDIFCFVSD